MDGGSQSTRPFLVFFFSVGEEKTKFLRALRGLADGYSVNDISAVLRLVIQHRLVREASKPDQYANRQMQLGRGTTIKIGDSKHLENAKEGHM